MRGEVALAPDPLSADSAPSEASDPEKDARGSAEPDFSDRGRPLALPEPRPVLEATVSKSPTVDAIDHGDAEATATMLRTMAHGSGITRW